MRDAPSEPILADKNALPGRISRCRFSAASRRQIFTVVARGGGRLLLAHLAPLPIMIIAFAFGLIHGATSAISHRSSWPLAASGDRHGISL
jgi:hypothetical protein